MVHTDAFFRTFFIRGAAYGTAFVVTVDGRQILITAKHLLDANDDKHDIRVFLRNEWKQYSMRLIGLGKGETDVALFDCPTDLQSSEFKLTPAQGSFVMGQDMYFLGFPYKLWGNTGEFLDGMPCAFVKKGTLSFFDSKENQVLYIDAINNEGFSGGPLLFFPPTRPSEMFVAGVVSKFRVEYEEILDEDGEKTRMSVPYNTGLLVAYGMKHVLEIVRQNLSAKA